MKIYFTFLTATALVLSVVDSIACACCSDPGEYRFKNDKLTGYELVQIQAMTFAPTAQRYSTDAGDDEVMGLASVSKSYGVSATMDLKGWRLTFQSEDGKTGFLMLPLPKKITVLAADIHDEETSGGGGPLLYKEWRFEGPARGEGIFQAGLVTAARYTLIFQGRGNRCDNGEDFKNWRLEVTGKKASYAFYGELQ